LELIFIFHPFGHGSRVVRGGLFMKLMLSDFLLGLVPVLNSVDAGLVDLIGSLGNLCCQIGGRFGLDIGPGVGFLFRFGFGWVENPIGEQFRTVIQEEPR
jgi:hypothetical protein